MSSLSPSGRRCRCWVDAVTVGSMLSPSPSSLSPSSLLPSHHRQGITVASLPSPRRRHHSRHHRRVIVLVVVLCRRRVVVVAVFFSSLHRFWYSWHCLASSHRWPSLVSLSAIARVVGGHRSCHRRCCCHCHPQLRLAGGENDQKYLSCCYAASRMHDSLCSLARFCLRIFFCASRLWIF